MADRPREIREIVAEVEELMSDIRSAVAEILRDQDRDRDPGGDPEEPG